MLLPFDQSNPKIKTAVSIITVVLVVVALVVVWKTVSPTGPQGPSKDLQSSIGYVLGDALAKAVGQGPIVVIGFSPPEGQPAPMTESQMEGVNSALKDHKDVTLLALARVPLFEPMMIDTIRPDEFDKIFKEYPDAKGFLSLIGLPRGGPGLVESLRGDERPMVVANDISGYEVESWIRAKRAAAVGVLNYYKKPLPSDANTDRRAKQFNKDFLVVTPENIDELGNVAAPGMMGPGAR